MASLSSLDAKPLPSQQQDIAEKQKKMILGWDAEQVKAEINEPVALFASA